MSTSLRPFPRLLAAWLLAWLLGQSVAAPLVACCAAPDPCCVVSTSAPDCTACAAAPAVVGQARPSHPVARSGVTPAPLHLAPGRLPDRPWKPPD